MKIQMRKRQQWQIILWSCFLFAACSFDRDAEVQSVSTDSEKDTTEDSGSDSSQETENGTLQDTESGICAPPCDAFEAAVPIISADGGQGSVTTYGSVSNPEVSSGGACNYGQTNLQYYAAIHVNVDSGDNLGPWQEGHACGSCLSVQAKTEQGWQKTFVRVVDRCADAFCGVDLGGAPARDIMLSGPGRYEGQWHWESCEGHPEVFDGPTALYVKDGSNEFWSLVQIRNPLSAVVQLSLLKEGETDDISLPWATEAENFFSVPQEVLQDSAQYTFTVQYQFGPSQTVTTSGNALSIAESVIEFSP